MADKCPPDEIFEVVTPGQALDEVRALAASVESFGLDVARGSKKNPPVADRFGNLIYPERWQAFDLAWTAWRSSWEEYRAGHDSWLDNFDAATVSRAVEQRKCDLNDFAARLRALGIDPQTPSQKFSSTADTTSNLVLFAGIALSAYLVSLVVSRGSR